MRVANVVSVARRYQFGPVHAESLVARETRAAEDVQSRVGIIGSVAFGQCLMPEEIVYVVHFRLAVASE